MKYSKKQQKKIIEFYKNYANGKQNEILNLSDFEMPVLNTWDDAQIFNKVFPLVINLQQEFPNITEQDLYGIDGFVSLLVPFQNTYNKIRTSRLQYLMTINQPSLLVEDGSVDIDALEEEGLKPGKILVYRQGAQQPSTINTYQYDSSLWEKEEERLILDMEYTYRAFKILMQEKYNHTV